MTLPAQLNGALRIKGVYLELTARYGASFCTRFWTAWRVPGGGSVSNSKLETWNSLIRSFVFGGIEFQIVLRGSSRIVECNFTQDLCNVAGYYLVIKCEREVV